MTLNIGDHWTDSKGRTWEVCEILPFGRCRVRTTDLRRVGEMQTKAVKKILEAANTIR